MSMQSWRYVPLLRNKSAEWSALATVSRADRAALMPIIEVIPESFVRKPATAARRGSTTSQLAIEELYELCRTELLRGALSIDSTLLRTRSAVSEAQFYEELNRRGRLAGLVPVLQPNADSGAIAAARALSVASGAGLALRVGGGTSHSELAGIVSRLGVSPGSIDLVVDLADSPRAVKHAALHEGC